jgi:hypothetical protein
MTGSPAVSVPFSGQKLQDNGEKHEGNCAPTFEGTSPLESQSTTPGALDSIRSSKRRRGSKRI